ncbi:MAG: toll/interleukin-1 receptor domain-containing protein, partial [Clostridiales bacterium]|nr:toll/interleukin-1 receptor domain-containing protein [Clostridiales bacterium]
PILWKLQQAGFRVWYDDGLTSGNDWKRQISERIRGSSVFLLVMSNYAIASENVHAEANYAQMHKRKIIIINFDNTDIDSGLFSGFAMYCLMSQMLKANFSYPESDKRKAFFEKLFHDLDQTTREEVPNIDD